MTKGAIFSFLFYLLNAALFAQSVPIAEYSVNENGQVELIVNSTSDNYYILKVRNDVSNEFDLTTSITLGKSGQTTIISEPLKAYPIEHYQVLEYSIDVPHDTDNDGVDDISEYLDQPTTNPINAAKETPFADGTIILDSFSLFSALSVSQPEVQWNEYLNGKRYLKFVISDFFSSPKVYFMNGAAHTFHNEFIQSQNINISNGEMIKGQVIYHPTIISDNGKPGVFAFNFSDGHGEDFSVLQRTQELLASNMPFLQNNMSYYVTSNSMAEYQRDSILISDSRVSVVYEEDVFADIDYLGLNTQEGFGFFREITDENEIPGLRDIVLFNSIPNSLPRVAGVMTSVLQTPLSHANLRAIQDNIPNAFIKDPLSIDSIAQLLNHNIYFKVEPERFIIRSATQEEVDRWFESLRPTTELIPPLNLDFKYITPLDEISFLMFDGFGAKCANVSTMRTFGFPKGVIPNGFGIPFYFYHEFMRVNNLFDDVEDLLEDQAFLEDRVLREEMLAEFRAKIKDAEMPNWMLRALTKMQSSFPEGTSIRCRSSTNNEDLPGFSGAGLYDSKTQHPEEGHISKSIKQVYASLWNLRAFDERHFYRVDHFVTSMGVLCHANFEDEKANGVGVTADPIYQTYDSFFYLNTQVGEDLVTNPLAASTPEEILLDINPASESDYVLIRYSNLAEQNEVILNKEHRNELREYLNVIHNKFETLYKADTNQTFAMEIEYKVTASNQLIIKQARPWVSYESDIDLTEKRIEESVLNVFPNPAENYIDVSCDRCEVTRFVILNMQGTIVTTQFRAYRSDETSRLDISSLGSGIYLLSGANAKGEIVISTKFIKE